MDYFKKYDENPAKDLLWNIPETRQGSINLIGGHAGSFRTIIKTAEFLNAKFPLENVQIILPDVLKGKVPDLPNFTFLSSTESGSFRDASELFQIYQTSDFNLLLGDFSKNEVTKKALENSLEMMQKETDGSAVLNSDGKYNFRKNDSAVSSSDNRYDIGTDDSAVASSETKGQDSSKKMSSRIKKPLLLTRDTIDLIATETATTWLSNDNLILFASMPQLQKLFRAIYYPKMLLLSQSLLQVADALHKFTLSFPVQIITLHGGEILVAKDGEVAATDLTHSGYSPFMLWSGELAAKIAAINLYNPQNFTKATLAAVFEEK